MATLSGTSGTAGHHRPRLSRGRLAVLALGVALIVAGVLVIAVPQYRVWQRGQADDQALQTWNAGGSAKLAGPVADATPLPAGLPTSTAAPGAVAACGGASAPASEYALVTFPSLSAYGYAGVAGNGTWDMLTQRSMVHYDTTPAPGQQGNVIIAFHREPNFEHIDGLNVGGIVDVQDRTCHTWQYRVTQRWELDPSDVTQLTQTNGHDLTLITCTPWYVDNHRYVWRATLVA
ncbi:MAG TPA: sortase [Candidatus Dormibacteraeota bacterium]|nr:sortase [Candidatus Dormibacteraeota bacterium]